jgi:two-component system response regulator YesN
MVSVIARGAVEYTQEQFHNIYGSTFSTVVAAQPVKLSDMSNIYKSLKRSMLSFIGGAREVILLDESEEENDTGKFDYADQVNALKRKLELRQKSDYFDILGKCMKLMTEKSSRHDTIALEIYYSISVLLLQFVNENHFQETIAFHVAMYKLTRADAHESWIEAAEYLTKVSKAVFLLLEEKEDKLANHALNRVVNYIDGHLDEELSLTALAEIGGFNSSYLSRLFKQVQNETIGDYILHKRLELAKKLLSDTDVKIQDISVKCGYISPHSFTRAFRNEVGISPTEYREIELDKRSQIM